MTLPLVTYVVASYNHARFVRQTIDSILGQDYPHIELLVCDDVSSDGSVELISSLAQERGFTFLRNESNQGCAGTMHRLVQSARGEYIGFLGSDDWIEPDKTARQIAFLQESGLDAVLSPLWLYDDATGTRRRQDLSGVCPFIESGNYLERLYSTDQDGAMVQSGLLRTEAVRAVSDCLLHFKSDDWMLMIRFLQAGNRVGFLDAPLMNYRHHANNTVKNAMYTLEQLQLPVVHNAIPVAYHPRILSVVYHSASVKLATRNRLLSVRYALRSFRQQPRLAHLVEYGANLVLGFPLCMKLWRMVKGAPRVQRQAVKTTG